MTFQRSDAGLLDPAQRKASAPLLLTAELPADVLAWADGLRQAHYPPDRNRLRAHVTLFHALPPSVEKELLGVLAELTRVPPPEACIDGLMKLGTGTALAVRSEAMVAIHTTIADRMHGLLTRQDAQPLRLHVTIQNKVTAQAARALQIALAPDLHPRSFRFRGLGLYAWQDGLWCPIRIIPFRG